MKKNIVLLITLGIAVVLAVQPSAAALTPYFDNLAGFNAAAGSPPIVQSFDSIPTGTDISGMHISGITFDKNTGGAPLIVVRAEDTFSGPGFTWATAANRLFATTGDQVLSPGGPLLAAGPDPSLENDDITLTFDTPVSSAGFDILYQSLDGWSWVAVTVYDSHGAVLYSNGFIPSSVVDNLGGSGFVGFVSDSEDIKMIVIDEYDENYINPDANIGIDTVRADIAPTPVPEFPSLIPPVSMIVGGLLAVCYINSTKTV